MHTAFVPRRAAGFTMVELITVIILVGILGAIGSSRFFSKTVFENRAYADQAKTIIRYAQKLAVARNRPVFVRSDGNSFAVCANAACDASGIVPAPGGSNDGSAATKLNCQQNNAYAPQWMCTGRPTGVTVAAETARPEFGAGGFFSFDAMGRPFNKDGSALTAMTLTFSSGGNTTRWLLWPETGYLQNVP
ncbi:prepilin-type N-terminal cleavage/methylation domain-containing protein [Pseudoduganella sp. FT25W]|uniref:Prepilin-type N-terminal cleavage/methylation domain-containing protein n=1 Tax=Duganella alba TaxID=2666081 RepID=A0A6L5QPT0_9BURK|nr:prepilin-type N-terminal cleavage/methylation domain-containing protein [Duganella alba]MRX20004.1 prepilin-type N-terminal cleavage/methylation domain-containing protein [Duganella alba]